MSATSSSGALHSIEATGSKPCRAISHALIVSSIIIPGRAYGEIPWPILNLHCLRSPVKVQQCHGIPWKFHTMHGDEVRDDDEVMGSPLSVICHANAQGPAFLDFPSLADWPLFGGDE